MLLGRKLKWDRKRRMEDAGMWENILMAAPLLCLAGGAMVSAEEPKAGAVGLSNAFFAMDTGTRDAQHETVASQAAMLKELGYAGIGWTAFDQLPELLKELDARNLKLFTLYLGLNIEPDNEKFDPKFKESLPLLKGRDVILWLTVTSSAYKPSSPEGDPRAVEVIRRIADEARPYGVRIALYPHITAWLERVEDAVRVAKEVDRDNVGATFNLYHCLVKDGPKDLEARLEKAMPVLFLVTINGSSPEGSIETLDHGAFDLCALLKTLQKLGYTRPIGLQGYGIGGDVHENLKRSIEAWRGLCKRAGGV